MKLKSFLLKPLKNYYHNAKGWQTNRKLVVFQSDDWGSIRTPSSMALDELRNFGVDSSRCHYMQNDTLASVKDLELLSEVLRKHNDSKGRSPVFTVNFLTRNPDFKAIKDTEYSTYKNLRNDLLSDNRKVDFIQFVNQEKDGLFFPQLHGREHLNIERWLTHLQKKNPIVCKAFKYGFWGISRHTSDQIESSLQAALDFDNQEYEKYLKRSVVMACHDFHEIFGFQSESFIAPNYIWSSEIDEALKENGVGYLQSGRVRIYPLGNGKYRRMRVYTGDRNKFGQIYLVRNVRFEPSENLTSDWVKQALLEVQAAFRMKRPAVIDTHRVNYMGGLNEDNRERSLDLLNQFLSVMEKRWPTLEYLNSVELGRLVADA